MQNSKFKMQNEFRKYATPEIEFVELDINDVITTSPAEAGTETPWYEESDGNWEISLGG